LKSSNYKAIFLIILITSVIVISSGCVGTKEQEAYDEEDAKNQTQANDTNQDEANNEVEQTKEESTSDSQVTTSKTEKKTSTPTKTESCNHPSVTTKYVGLDKATGKIIYDTYCSKCGEYLGRVLY
jgi:cytoskeletal protein RodZ